MLLLIVIGGTRRPAPEGTAPLLAVVGQPKVLLSDPHSYSGADQAQLHLLAGSVTWRLECRQKGADRKADRVPRGRSRGPALRCGGLDPGGQSPSTRSRDPGPGAPVPEHCTGDRTGPGRLCPRAPLPMSRWPGRHRSACPDSAPEGGQSNHDAASASGLATLGSVQQLAHARHAGASFRGARAVEDEFEGGDRGHPPKCSDCFSRSPSHLREPSWSRSRSRACCCPVWPPRWRGLPPGKHPCLRTIDTGGGGDVVVLDLWRTIVGPAPSSCEEEGMRYSSQVKSISYLKAKAADILSDLEKRREPLIITQHGEAKAASRTWLPTRRCRRPWRS